MAVLPDIAVVVLFEMFFEEGDGRKFLIDFARFSSDFDEALELCKFLEGISAGLADMEDISKLGIGDDLGFDLVVGDNLVGDDDVLEFHLFRGMGTLQMGHWLFLLITRIL